MDEPYISTGTHRVLLQCQQREAVSRNREDVRRKAGFMEAAGVGARAAEEVAEDQVCIEGMGRDERRKVSLMPYRERWNSVCSICRRTTLSRPLINHFLWISPASLSSCYRDHGMGMWSKISQQWTLRGLNPRPHAICNCAKQARYHCAKRPCGSTAFISI